MGYQHNLKTNEADAVWYYEKGRLFSDSWLSKRLRIRYISRSLFCKDYIKLVAVEA
jgi:hypothetical protein